MVFPLATSFVTLKGLLTLVVISSTLESCRFSRLQEVVQTCRFLSATPPHRLFWVCPQPWVVIPGRYDVQVNPCLSLSLGLWRVGAPGARLVRGGEVFAHHSPLAFLCDGCSLGSRCRLQQCLLFILLLCLVSARAGSLSLLAPVYIASFVSMHLFIICLCCTDCSLRWLPLFHGIGIFSFISPLCFGSHFVSTVVSSFLCVHHYLW